MDPLKTFQSKKKIPFETRVNKSSVCTRFLDLLSFHFGGRRGDGVVSFIDNISVKNKVILLKILENKTQSQR